MAQSWVVSVIDGGHFDWSQNDKFPGITQPNPSYHGVIFHEACGDIAYIMKIRTTLMRDQVLVYHLSFLFIVARIRNIVIKSGTSCGKCMQGGKLSFSTSNG